jgi:hypothetical protein
MPNVNGTAVGSVVVIGAVVAVGVAVWHAVNSMTNTIMNDVMIITLFLDIYDFSSTSNQRYKMDRLGNIVG